MGLKVCLPLSCRVKSNLQWPTPLYSLTLAVFQSLTFLESTMGSFHYPWLIFEPSISYIPGSCKSLNSSCSDFFSHLWLWGRLMYHLDSVHQSSSNEILRRREGLEYWLSATLLPLPWPLITGPERESRCSCLFSIFPLFFLVPQNFESHTI